jgi:hypothetical protein
MSNEPGNSPNVLGHRIKSKRIRERPEKRDMKIAKKADGPKYYVCTPDPPKLG